MIPNEYPSPPLLDSIPGSSIKPAERGLGPLAINILTCLWQVEKLIELLGIQKIADSLVGSPLSGGISGGERKRVHIGMELVCDATAVFCDEVWPWQETKKRKKKGKKESKSN
jgi:hypothetical protein